MLACWKALLMSLHFCCSGSEMVHHRTSIPPSAGVGGGGRWARTVRPGSCSPSPCVPSARIASPVHQPCPLTVGYWGTKRGPGSLAKLCVGHALPALAQRGSELGPLHRPGRVSLGSSWASPARPSLAWSTAWWVEGALAVSCPLGSVCLQQEGARLGFLTHWCPWALLMNWDLRLGSGCGCP